VLRANSPRHRKDLPADEFALLECVSLPLQILLSGRQSFLDNGHALPMPAFSLQNNIRNIRLFIRVIGRRKHDLGQIQIVDFR
jgi:hypothetical protein